MAGEAEGTAPAAAPTSATPPTDPSGTPPEQPVAGQGAPTGGQGNEPQVNVPALQAGYTRASQINASIRTALGLPNTAGAEDIDAAIAALKAPKPTPGTPEEDEREARFRDRAWSIEKRVYGDEAVAHGQQVENLIRHGAEPDQIMQAIFAAASVLTGQAPPAPAPTSNGNGHEPPPAPTSEQSLAADEMESPHGGLGLLSTADATTGLEGSGDTRAWGDILFGGIDRAKQRVGRRG